MYLTTLCGFWGDFSGHFARLACNHSYGYAHGLIIHGANRECDSLTYFIKYTPLSACSCNMRARVTGRYFGMQLPMHVQCYDGLANAAPRLYQGK